VKDTTRVELVRSDRALTKPNKRNLNRNVPLPTSLPKATIVQPVVAVAPRPDLDDSGSVRQVLEGATLAGPVADRPILNYRSPDYPDWAKQEAVEGSVRLHFTVLPDGQVKRNVLVEKTSGFEDFDRNATVALLDWQFEPLPGGASGEQWGTITLNYRLDDAR
jgi:TonB family protein